MLKKNIKKHFPDPLNGMFVGKGQWKLTSPFKYISDKYVSVIVPNGFVSDGASIPKLFYTIIGSPWSGKYSRGAIIHDYLYFKKEVSRKIADLTFLEAMLVLGVPLWKRLIMYRALRMFGMFAWRAKDAKNKKVVKESIKENKAS